MISQKKALMSIMNLVFIKGFQMLCTNSEDGIKNGYFFWKGKGRKI